MSRPPRSPADGVAASLPPNLPVELVIGVIAVAGAIAGIAVLATGAITI